MTENEKLQRLLDEQKFPYLNMSLEERNYYLNIIKHCKDICDTNHKIDDSSTCTIVEMSLKKDSEGIHVNGSLEIGNKIKEYRFIDADIYILKDKIIVDMLIERLKAKDKIKEYRVLDEFYLENDILKRRSQYSYDMKSMYTNITDQKMKGRLK